MKKISTIIFLCFFLGCQSSKEITAPFEASLTYEIAKELYFENSIDEIFRNRIGQKVKCKIYETQSKSYTVVFPQINTYGNGWLEMYGEDMAGTSIFSGSCTISAKKLPKGKKIAEFELTIPENWKSIASAFDETYDKKIGMVQKVLMQYIKTELKVNTNIFYIAPFTKYAESVQVLWVEGKMGYTISLDDDTLQNNPGFAVRDTELKDARQIYIDNCMKDGRKIIIKSN